MSRDRDYLDLDVPFDAMLGDKSVSRAMMGRPDPAREEIQTLTARLAESENRRELAMAAQRGAISRAENYVRRIAVLEEEVERLRGASSKLVRDLGQADRQLDRLSTGNLPHQRGVISCAIRYPLR